MNWIHPEWLWTTLLLIPLVLVVLAAGLWHRSRIRAAFGPTLADRVLPASVRVRRTIRDVCMLTALLLGAFALAEPAFDKSISQQKVQGVDLVVALDLSRSMDAEDVAPNRLERARREIIDLLGEITGDRVAVVFFAGDAIARLPLTEDHRAVEWLLGDASTSMFQAQGSNLARAIAVSRDLLARDEGKAGKALVVFSDGESEDPEAALAEADAGRAEGLTIYTVGIGEGKTSIPTPGGPLRHKGSVVYTEPDFTTLQEVARRTGGAYVKSVASASDMRGLYAAIRAGVRSAERETISRESWNSAYQVPLGLGLGFWLFGAFLGDGHRRYGAAGAVLLALSVATGSAQAATPAEADALFRADKLPAAEQAFEELALQNPGNADLYRRLGAVRYRMGDFVGAASAFERANALAGGDADALYNAGNARYRAGQLETALDRYDRALGLTDHAPSRANREVVAGELQARRAEQPPPPPEPSEGSGEEENEDGSGDQEQQDKQDGGGEQDQQDPSQGNEKGEQPEDQGNQGDQQDGQQQEPQDGSADAEGQQKGEQDQKDPKDGSGQGSPSQQDPGDQNSEGVTPDQLDQDGEDGEDGEKGEQDGAAGQPGEEGTEQMSGNITPAQAARMIDGVEEGQMRVHMVGASSTRPW